MYEFSKKTALDWEPHVPKSHDCREDYFSRNEEGQRKCKLRSVWLGLVLGYHTHA